MLISKLFLTMTTAATLFGGSHAQANVQASNNSFVMPEKAYYYQGTDLNEINNIIETYFNNNISQTAANTPQTQSKTVQTVAPKHVTQQHIISKPTVKQTTAAPKPAAQQTAKKNQPAVKQTVTTKKPAVQQTAKTNQPAAKETAATKKPATTQTASTLSAFEQKVVDLTNQERAQYGLPALKVDVTLSKMAHAKSLDMSKNNYFSHTSPTFGSPFEMMKQFGITYSYAGENIAMGQQTPEEVVNAWMNSAGHRANILNPNYNYIGVGYVAQGNYWTQDFIGK